MKYDIFISYRRKESSGRSNVPMARTFKLEFERRGYKVFFDYSECTDNYFSDTILPAIRTCDFFVLVLTKDCLARCVNEGDWVRREIEDGIAYNRKIVPITPDKECDTWPDLLPSLSILKGLQITTIYTDHMFEAGVEFVVKNRFHLNEGKSETVDETKQQKVAQSDNSIKDKPKQSNRTIYFNGYEYIDLGLPSATFWATCNVGAAVPEGYGYYFSWDECKKHKKEPSKLGYWSMPTNAQWKELIQNTRNTWTTRNGTNGRLFIANNGNEIFLPAAGIRLWDRELQYDADYGYYWSWSWSLYMRRLGRAWNLYFSSGGYGMNYGNYFAWGRPVRAVHSEPQN